MKKKLILLTGTVLFIGGTASLQAHHDHGRGVRLAADIVHLVKTVVTPPPKVIVTPAPAPVVVTPPPAPVAVPAYSYGYYNNVYVPMYNGWYYYGNAWCWGGRGPRPHHPPRWVPPPRRHHHHRPAPPPPPPRYRAPAARPAPPPPPRYRAPAARPAPPRHGGHGGHGGHHHRGGRR